MIALYIRVSTDSQDNLSQQTQLAAWLRQRPTEPVTEYLDTASGAKRWQDRALADALRNSQPGDSIAVSEISRIARSTLGVLSFLEAAAAAHVHVHAVRSGIALDGSMSAKITITILALCAEIERDLLRERTTAALAARRANGQVLGRPLGARSASKLTKRAPEIDRLLAADVSKRAIARLLDCSPQTLYTFLSRRDSDPSP